MPPSTLWIVQKIGQISSGVMYNQSNITYNGATTQYGGTYLNVWTIQASY